VFAGHRKSVTTIYFSPNSRSLVAGDAYGSVRIWSIRDGYSKELIDDAKNILSVTFSPDGRHIASADVHGWLRIWDARTGQLLDTWEGHTQDALCVAFSPDGKGLVSGSGDAILRYWDVSSLAVMKTGRGRVIGGTPGQRFPQIRTFKGHTARNF
jgi:WD40 repeat protein